MKKQVHPQKTIAIASRIVMPNECNTLNNLMGGNLLSWLDINSAISAHRFCNRIVVTAAVNNVAFDHPIRHGDIVTIESKVSRSFNSSMEVFSDVYVEDHRTEKKLKCNEAIYTFVAVDQIGSPIEVPIIQPETALEKSRYGSALRRRQLSLLLAKKIQPKEASELYDFICNVN